MNVGLMVTLLVGGLGLGGTLGFFFGQTQGRKAAVSGLEVVTQGGNDQQLFLLGDKVFTTSELPTDLQSRIYSAESEAFGQKEGLLKEFALRLALSQRKGGEVDINRLPELEDLLDPPTVSESEMLEFYEENKDRLPPGTEYEQIKDRLEQFLASQKGAEVFHEEWDKMVASGQVKLLVGAPKAPMVSIPVEKFPFKGSESAPHTLVEVSDYLCPHCQSVHPQVKAAIEELGQQVRLVQITFPLRPANLSGSLAEGAFCAQKQGNENFWKYHNAAYAGSWGSMGDSPNHDTVKEIAQKAGIDEEAFASCLESNEAREFIDESREIVSAMGVTGTPTFFFNNRRLNLAPGESLANALKDRIKNGETGI